MAHCVTGPGAGQEGGPPLRDSMPLPLGPTPPRAPLRGPGSQGHACVSTAPQTLMCDFTYFHISVSIHDHDDVCKHVALRDQDSPFRHGHFPRGKPS